MKKTTSTSCYLHESDKSAHVVRPVAVPKRKYLSHPSKICSRRSRSKWRSVSLQSRIYCTLCGYYCVLSKDRSCNTKQPQELLSKRERKGGKTGTGHWEAMVVIVNVRIHLLELSEVWSIFKIRSGCGDEYTDQMAVTWFIWAVYVWWTQRSSFSLVGKSCWTSNTLRGGGK